MRVEINNKLVRVIFLTLAIFALIVAIVAHFLGGDFLLVLIGLEVGLALGYYIYLYQIKRIFALELDSSSGELKVIYNKGGSTVTLDKSATNLTFETRKNNNHQDVEVLVIRHRGEVFRTIWPGLSGFVIDDLKALKVAHDEVVL
ncbi:hypothetical protein [Phaeocystidibacter luteus]|uniref:Uncharacterized protein n=1 Tax=Phaeocystidibacter luteus TaxID=911197 RepID=A0A6N6RFH8_9FLAO|nr:hypothetical protein [Phaeocystidibacter luteus]KAB2809824.1 hypothetical protein F8C67_09735 [Phaeocystidibacter luteus]